MKNKLTKREQARYDRIVRETVKLLKLGEWDINIAFVDEDAVSEALGETKEENSTTLGFSWWDADITKAYIGVCWPAIHREVDGEWEDTLIHELVHIRLGGHEAPNGRDLATERNVNIVTMLVRKAIGI